MKEDIESVLFSQEQLDARVSELGAQITKDYQGKKPIILCVMKGAMVFTADLMRKIDLPCTLEHITLSSYRNLAKSSGEVTMQEPFDVDLTGQDVIVVEDILDTGNTLSFVLKLLRKMNPASLKLVVLLDKPSRRVAQVEADMVGFTIPDAFVVGYGLDYDQHYRNLPYIGILAPHVYS